MRSSKRAGLSLVWRVNVEPTTELAKKAPLCLRSFSAKQANLLKFFGTDYTAVLFNLIENSKALLKIVKFLTVLKNYFY